MEYRNKGPNKMKIKIKIEKGPIGTKNKVQRPLYVLYLFNSPLVLDHCI